MTEIIISHQHRFVCFSNPRCGSTSLRNLLEPYGDIRGVPEYPFHNHANSVSLRATFSREGWEWNDYVAFTTIRNPWARIVSMWEYAEVMPESVWAIHRRKANTFQRFVLGLTDYMEEMYAERHPSTGMSSMTISQFVDSSVRIFRLEDISRDLPPLLESLGISEVDIPHHNSTSHRPYRDYYSWRTRRTVSKFMAADIDEGNYVF